MTLRLTTMPKPRRRTRVAREDDRQPIEAVVVDEHHQPVERVIGAETLNVSVDEIALRSPLPLMPGLRLLVQVGDPHSPGGKRRQIELQVLACNPWLGAHRVRTRIVEGRMPRELLRAAA